MYTKKIQMSRGIFYGIPLAKATDGARLAEMHGKIKDVRKLSSISESLEVTRELVGFPKIFCLSKRALFFPCLHSLI